MGKIVAVLGATDHPDRFANRAIKQLKANGHTVLPVNPLYDNVDGTKCSRSLTDCHETIDTVTVYVNPERAASYIDDIISVNPERVILNPGTENSQMAERLREAGITVVEDCTLVMLNRNKF